MSKKVLVIDDEEVIRKSFILTFEGTEYQVDTANSGEKGIKMSNMAKYDLIFLNLRMPGMNGVETLRELRKIDKEIPIYIVTAFHQAYFEQLKGAEEDGIDFEVLRKPVDSEQLTSIVRGVLDGPKRY
jgi:CheY-like chemotaxis protein